ncbi:hypothetical protein ACWKWC_04715 [Geodermatophilus nigrescens]
MPGGVAPPPGPPDEDAEAERSGGSRGKAAVRAVLAPALIAVVVGTAFVAVFLAAFSDPGPHDLAVGVAGPPEQVQQVCDGLEQARPGALRVVPLAGGPEAAEAVRRNDVYGALVLGGRAPQLLVAGAHGQGVTQTLTQAFGPVAQQAGAQLQVQDLVPLAAGDTRGLAIFYASFGVVLGGFLFGIQTYQAAPQLGLTKRIASALLFASVSGVAVALLADVTFGSVPAGFLAVGGLVALLALSIASTAALVLRLIGSAGTFVTSVGLLILGNATSTGNLPAEYLPGWLQPLAGILPPGVAVRALRGVTYFEGDGVARAYVVLGLWCVVPALLIVLVDAVARRRRARAA